MSNEKVPLVAPTVGGFVEEHKKKEGKGYLVYGVIATALCMGIVANSNGIFTSSEANLLRSSTSDEVPRSIIFAVSDNVYTKDVNGKPCQGPVCRWADRMKIFRKATHDPNKWKYVSLYAFQESKTGSLKNLPFGSCLKGDDGLISNLDEPSKWDSVSYDKDPDSSIAWDTTVWTIQGVGKKEELNKDNYDYRSVVGACLQHKKNGKKLFFGSYHGSIPNWYANKNKGSRAGRLEEQRKVMKFMDTHKTSCGNNGLLLGDFNDNKPPTTLDGWTRYGEGGNQKNDWVYGKGFIKDIFVEAKVHVQYTGSDHFPLEVKFQL